MAGTPEFRKPWWQLNAMPGVEREEKVRMHHVRTLALVMALAVVGASSAGAVSARAVPARQDEIPLDLAALAIYPQDTGTDGYVLVDGRTCLSAAACADPVFFGAAT